MGIKGIGKVKAIQILCLSELAKRLAKATAGESLCFSSPESIAKYYMEDMRHRQQEYMKLLLFNTRTKLILSLIHISAGHEGRRDHQRRLPGRRG